VKSISRPQVHNGSVYRQSKALIKLKTPTQRRRKGQNLLRQFPVVSP